MITAWQSYIESFQDWKHLVQDVAPIQTNSGLIYELGQPLDSFNASIAVADMRDIPFAEPHYHQETEIYYILQGEGVLVVGNKEEPIHEGSIILIPSNIAHYTIPSTDLIIAVVSIPPYNPQNYIPLDKDNPTYQFDFDLFKKLVHGRLQ